MPIRELSPLLINQIAAGEVIERPASVVKELAENAIDAGATELHIEIEEGGRKKIIIHDDGCGIPPWELKLAITPHATSKLHEPDDLAKVATLGFRGEAMASIASISRMTITSKASALRREESLKSSEQNDELPALQSLDAASLTVEGSDNVDIKPATIRHGTRIEVNDLFFNTPARRKFLKSAQAESGQINEAITRLALVHPEIGFTFISDGKKKVSLPSRQSDRDRVIAMIGKDTPEGFVEFSREDHKYRQPDTEDNQDNPDWMPTAQVWGLAGKPELARGSGKFQHVCLNGRPIRDRSLSHAIKEAYRGILPGNKYPVCAVFLTVDPGLVDVNVHPAKLEVRFRQPNQVYSLILHAMREALLGEDLTPSFSIAQPPPAAQETRDSQQAQAPTEKNIPELLYPSSRPSSGSPSQPRSATTETTTTGTITKGSATKGSVGKLAQIVAPSRQPMVLSEMKEALERPDTSDPAGTSKDSEKTPVQSPASNEIGDFETDLNKPILQIHNSYLITEDENGLVIIDQHALHERIMFEHLYERLFKDQKKLASQRLLVPDTLTCDDSQLAIVEQMQPLLDMIGIEAGPIGPESLAIHAFPTLLFDRKVKPGPFVRELIEKTEQGILKLPDTYEQNEQGEVDQNLIEGALHKVLDMMSCKAAVKAGDNMSQLELKALLKQKDEIERSSNCPHGRPTTLSLSLKDLEKQFERS